MTKQKDLKRVVRTRMQKTGESYTAARQQLLNKKEPAVDFAALAGMSDDKVAEKTGRTWAQWVRVLDSVKAAEKPHREIAEYVSSLGTPDWWSQTVTVGYERIRGLRDRGQRRGGNYEASKSRTYPVSLARLFDAFANDDFRAQWLPESSVRSKTKDKRLRLEWHDGTVVAVEFLSKGPAKTSVAIAHLKLKSKAAADAIKKEWAGYFDRLAELL
ncbi:MAG TPA: hypothetical protein VNI54_12240 [Thermoanaerobaculia bacterium]|nr:hypothetical protein [Thermoanaerobaculia bacterium]